MAFENVFGNVDFRMLPAAKQQQQQTFLTMLGKGIEQGQRAKEFDLRKRQLEYEMSKPPEFDLNQVATTAAMKRQLGLEVTPQEEAALSVKAQITGPKIYTDEFGNRVVQPSGWASMMGGITAPSAPPSPGMTLPGAGASTNYVDDIGVTDPQAAQRVAAIAAQSDVSQVEPVLKENLPPVQSSGASPALAQAADYLGAPTRFTGSPAEDLARGKGNIALQEYAAKKNVDLQFLDAEQRKKLAFEMAKEKQKATPGREQFEKQLSIVLQDLDALKEQGGTISEEQGFIQNVGARMAETPFVGPLVQSTLDPETETLRNKIDAKRPILFNAIKKASGLTGTELNSQFEVENQLKQLGNPNMTYEARKAILTDLSEIFGTGELSQKGAPPSFSSEQEALGADLAPGTEIIINDRKAVVE